MFQRVLSVFMTMSAVCFSCEMDFNEQRVYDFSLKEGVKGHARIIFFYENGSPKFKHDINARFCENGSHKKAVLNSTSSLEDPFRTEIFPIIGKENLHLRDIAPEGKIIWDLIEDSLNKAGIVWQRSSENSPLKP